MTDAAIKATFADFRIIKGRKVAQLVLEVPLENADAALDVLGGVPMPDRERWCAIARLTDEAARKPDARERYALASEGEQAVVRSNLLCGDADFRRWCGALHAEQAGHYIRSICKVESRSELATNPEALQRFLDLEARFKSERQFGPHAARL